MDLEKRIEREINNLEQVLNNKDVKETGINNKLCKIKLKYEKMLAYQEFVEAKVRLYKMEVQLAECEINEELNEIRRSKRINCDIKEPSTKKAKSNTSKSRKRSDRTRNDKENIKFNENNKIISKIQSLKDYKQFKSGIKFTSNHELQILDNKDGNRIPAKTSHDHFTHKCLENEYNATFLVKHGTNSNKNIINKDYFEAKNVNKRDISKDETLKLEELSSENDYFVHENKYSNIEEKCQKFNETISNKENMAPSHKDAKNLFKVYNKIMSTKNTNRIRNCEIRDEVFILKEHLNVETETDKIGFEKVKSNLISKWRMDEKENYETRKTMVPQNEVERSKLGAVPPKDCMHKPLYKVIQSSNTKLKVQKQNCLVCGIVSENHVCSYFKRKINRRHHI